MQNSINLTHMFNDNLREEDLLTKEEMLKIKGSGCFGGCSFSGSPCACLDLPGDGNADNATYDNRNSSMDNDNLHMAGDYVFETPTDLSGWGWSLGNATWDYLWGFC
jgi:hypothetical protein